PRRGRPARAPGLPVVPHRVGAGVRAARTAGPAAGRAARVHGGHRARRALRHLRQLQEQSMIEIPGAVAVEAIDEGSRDAGVAAHYGDPMREQRLLATDVGLVDRSHRGVLAVPGPERASWLHTLTSQHLSNLSAGQGTELLVLSPHGHIEHHALVAEDGTTTWLDTEPGAAGDLLGYLERMRFFTQVEPRDATSEWAVLSLVGPRAVDAAETLGV